MPVQQVNTNLPSSVNEAPAEAPVDEAHAPVETQGVQAPPPAPAQADGVGGFRQTTGSGSSSNYFGSIQDTGQGAFDGKLEEFGQANQGNPAVMAALNSAAAEIKSNMAAFTNPDGTPNMEAFGNLVMQKFQGVGDVTIPTPQQVKSEQATFRQVDGDTTTQRSQRTTTGETQASQRTVTDNPEIPQGQRQIVSQSNGIVYKNLAGMGDGDIMALAFIVMMEAAKSAREDLKAIMDGVKAINKEKEGWRQVSNEVNKLAAGTAGKNEDFKANEIPNIKTGGQSSLDGKPVGTYVLDGNNLRFNTPGPDGSVAKNGLVIAGTGAGGAVTKKDIDTAKDTVKNKLDSLSEMGEMESLRLQMAMDRLSKLMSTLSNLLKKASETASGITQNIK
ncbi:MAG: hypothetical protein IT381_22830 [Deltaproteobacteria bacterium]|nr:hypothetical protein [Deltaproteobacteria bacterium]